MYMVTMAARISQSSLASDARNASAAPWKRICALAGSERSRCAASIAVTASPRDAPGARLNEIVAAHGLRVGNVFHAGDGNLHPNILYDPRKPGEEARVVEAGAQIMKVCAEVGGSISAITRSVGTMWAFYTAAAFMALWMTLAGPSWGPLHKVDPYPFAFLLFLGNIVQLLLMFVIMVGQQVLGAASDKRAVVTYQDAEAILHECLQMQEHLTAQDRALERMIRRLEQLQAKMEGSAG